METGDGDQGQDRRRRTMGNQAGVVEIGSPQSGGEHRLEEEMREGTEDMG